MNQNIGSTIAVICFALAVGLPALALGAGIATGIFTGLMRLFGIW